MAPGEPSWYGTFLTHVGNWFGSAGVQQTWVLAVVSVIVGLGPLLVWRFEVFLGIGALLALFFWVTGPGLGGVLTGSGHRSQQRTPRHRPRFRHGAHHGARGSLVMDTASRRSFVRGRHPALSGAGVIGFLSALLLGRQLPGRRSENEQRWHVRHVDVELVGLVGLERIADVDAGHGERLGDGHECTLQRRQQWGAAQRAGPHQLPRAWPWERARGDSTMNMNGADAGADRGPQHDEGELVLQDGPALPAAEANELLADGPNGPDDVHMALLGLPTSEPTFSQEINAFGYVQATSAGRGSVRNPGQRSGCGVRAGVAHTIYPVTYYVNPQVAAANEAASRILNPAAVDGLVHARDSLKASSALAAAMYLLPSSVTSAPMPYGPLVQWHQRTEVCGSALPRQPHSARCDHRGPHRASPGTVKRATPYMTMVWQIPVAGGPLAIQPPDVQIVEAAVMRAGS